MALRQCDKCSEMVDEAKAFCPGCGNSLVLETKREVVSNFESFEGTINLGDTMFNQMLSDMGLNISKAPDTDATRVEVLTPEPAAAPEPARAAEKQNPSSNTKWFILAGAVIVLFFLLVVAIIAVLWVMKYGLSF